MLEAKTTPEQDASCRAETMAHDTGPQPEFETLERAV